MGWRGWRVRGDGVPSQKIIKTRKFRQKITKIKVSTFWKSGKSSDSRWRPMPACSPVSFKQSRLSFCDIPGQIFEKIQKVRVLAGRALTLVATTSAAKYVARLVVAGTSGCHGGCFAGELTRRSTLRVLGVATTH